MLAEALAAYQRGETHIQHELLDEVEPLLFGMVRSLLGGDEREAALEHAQALTLAFHLQACAGCVVARTAADLRAYAHRTALARIKDPEPLRLCPLADEETGSMVHKCLGLGLAVEEALSEDQLEIFAERLAGRPMEAIAGVSDLETVDAIWADGYCRLVELGIVAET